jgi:DNA repair protein RadC
MMDIEVLDHLVIGHGKYVRLKERRPGVWTKRAGRH